MVTWTARGTLAPLVLVLALGTAGAGAPAPAAASPGPAPATAAPPGSAPATAAPRPAPAAADRARAAVDPGLRASRGGDVRVVVRLRPGASRDAREQVRRLGGAVEQELPLIDGFAAALPYGALDRLAEHDDVEVLSADRRVHVQGGPAPSGPAASGPVPSGPAASGAAGSAAGGGAAAPRAPLAPRVVGADRAWAAGATGAGVTVALVDTGIAAVPDLAGRIVGVRDDRTGRTSPCYDLSGEGSCADTFGHGTFMAGLIAGDGASGAVGPTGTAPDARLLSVKVAGKEGAADVSTVLAAIQWVVSFRDRYDIRVLNLSLGTDSVQPWKDDPLNYAVERAWDAGIVVVVAAANTGPAPGSIAKPGDDPWVVTVGAVDDRGTPGSGDDRVPDFSSRGPTADGIAKPDVVAPGAHVRSLRSPGSMLEQAFPTGDATSPYRTGSGTSMATAVVSGVVATALQAHPDLSPDQVKHALRAGARRVATDDPAAVGAGLVDAGQVAVDPAPGAANQGLTHSTGRGSLALSRGSVLVRADDPLGTLLTGRQTAQLLLWDPVGFTARDWTPAAWYTSVNALAGWNSARWTSTWDGHNWTGHNWTGHNWTGSSWYGTHEDASSYGRSGDGSASYGAWD